MISIRILLELLPLRALFCCLLAMVATAPARAEPVTIFAAASLTSVITEAARQFEKETGMQTRLSFASTSTLAHQIEAGAPADLFLSANIRWMDYLTEIGFVSPDNQFKRLSNELVLIAAAYLEAKPLTVVDKNSFKAILEDGGHLAMGDPDHVPVGMYGKAALQQLNLWQDLESHVARADNALAAVSLVQRGETPLGIVYRTDTINQPKLHILYHFETKTNPILYSLATIRNSNNPHAKIFFKYLVGDRGLALFKKFGFVILDEQNAE